ncbi:GntR family transcriptional regulator [Brevibacillus sp. TJ4]|uniref:GntR family transcriptional regulator n=1 Tax=Brevibacillus sp. TJ4 TaxID=3234853 RepID=UPI0037D0AF1F
MDAYTFIKNAIIQGKYEPGTRLAEESLAKELNVSRTPIREAIKQLEAEGLVTPLKRGVSVKTFTQEDIRQIYDLRTLLESYAASQAAIHRTTDDLAKMEHAQALFDELIAQPIEADPDRIQKIAAVNHLFHDAVVTASHNAHIHFHISKVVVVPIIYRSFFSYDAFQLRQSLQAHKTIFAAIQNQDPERARIAMHEHIFQGRDSVMRRLRKVCDEKESPE